MLSLVVKQHYCFQTSKIRGTPQEHLHSAGFRAAQNHFSSGKFLWVGLVGSSTRSSSGRLEPACSKVYSNGALVTQDATNTTANKDIIYNLFI